jgi:phage terminase large subunit
VASNPKDKERFSNLRAELYWNLREALNPDLEEPIALPPDDELLMELSSVKYQIDSRGRTKLEPKEDMKKRIGRSPDRADAVVLAFAPVARQPVNRDRAVAALRGGRVW